MVVGAALMGAGPADSSRQAVSDAMKEGHWADALKIARLRLDSGQAVGDDLRDAAECLRQLGRLEGFDPLVEQAVDRYGDSPEMLVAAMQAYRSTPSYGHEVAGEFRRGQQRGRGATLSIEEADRVRVLRLGERVLGLVDDAESRWAHLALDTLREALVDNRRGDFAWRLQLLTDLRAELPEPDPRWNASVAPSDPPVTAQGDMPVLYEVPAGWEAAKSDGERWRWTMAEIARRRPELADGMTLQYAYFLREQFGVQSLVQQGWFRPAAAADDGPSDETSALAVETLADSETIARLATGVRRFTLPEGHRFVEMFREVEDWSTLHDIYLNRNQRSKAAEAARQALEQADDESQRERWRSNLSQIVDPWVRFESTTPQPAGRGATLRITHRNAAQIGFTAKRVDVAKLLADVREVLTNPPEDYNRRDLQVEQIGWRLVHADGERYLGETVAEWSAEVETPPRHNDGAAAIASPLQNAGAYLVTATPKGEGEDGAKLNVVVWIADTALVRKPTDSGAIYQALDAQSGAPVNAATLDLFGYREQRDRLPGGQRPPRVETTRRVAATDAGGLAVLDLAPPEGEPPYTWLAVATTDEGRLAHLGFEGIWRSQADADPPQNPRTFVVTDRPVYRPGDTVNYRVWIGRPDYLASVDSGPDAQPSEFAHKEFKVELYDARGDKLATKRLTADQYGALAGTLPTTEAATLGVYRIDVVGFGSGGFRVEEYRKPEFEVFVDAPDEPTRLGETFDTVVRANYYSGAPVAGARVKYKVVRTRKSNRWLPPRPWDWLYGRGYAWLGQDAPYRADWGRWGCPGPLPPWLPQPSGPPEVVAQGEATLDSQGRFGLPIDTDPAKQRLPDVDHQYEITAEVTDAGRRTITGSGSVLAARRPVDVTVWLSRGFYDVGDTIRAQIAVRRPDGQPVAAGGELRLLKVLPPQSPTPLPPDGQPTKLVDPKEELVESWTLPTDDSGAASMRLKASEAGRYRLVYKSAAADAGVEGGVLFTIRGPGFDGGQFRYNALEVIPDKAEYAPGDTARLLINTDRAGSTVSLYVRPVGGVYGKPRVLKLEGKSTLVELDVTAGDLPNFYVEATTVADGELHVAAKQLVVPPESRVLKVEASPSAKAYLPGEKGKLQVRLTDSAGEPVVGAATLAVYDRSVEAIAGGPSGGDIRERFWDWKRQHSPTTSHNLDRQEWPVTAEGVPMMQSLGVFGDVVPRRGGFAAGHVRAPFYQEMLMSRATPASAPAMAEADGFADLYVNLPVSKATGAAAPEVAVRKDFADTALWVASVETDKDGFAELAMPLPESLTSWKVRAWAIAPGLRVGQGEAEVVTRKDLMVRLRTPRFLVDGDRATFSALVQNQSSRELSVRVRLEVDGEALSVRESSERSVTIGAGEERLVDWGVAASAAGRVTVRAIAVADGEPPLSDAMQLELPVLVHGAEIVDSFSAVIAPDEGLTTFTLVVPENRRPEATRLDVRYSPTLVGAMLDTLPYLIEYPHGCTEQTLNRFLPAVIVRQTISDLGVDLADLKPAEGEANGPQPPDRPNPVFDPNELDKIVRQGVNRLVQMQLADGGWGWFSGLGEHSSPHTTAVVARGLGIAKEAGVAVPDEVLSRGYDWLAAYRDRQLAALANADDEGNRLDKDKPYKRHADNLDALVELTLGRGGRPSEGMLGRLYEDRLQLAPYSLATLGMALHVDATRDQPTRDDSADRRATVLRNLKQFVRTDDENQTAYLDLPGGYWWLWYGAEYEAHAYFLKLLAATEPRGELAPKLVKYLLANRRHATRWNSTRDTALVVEAMADYVRASGEAAAEGTVEVWLDGKKRQTERFDAAGALRFDGRFVLAGEELSAGRHTLELRKTGEGRLYAGASLTNFSLEDDLRAAGLEVRVSRRVQKLVPVEEQAADVDKRGQAYSVAVENYRRVDVPNLGEVQSGDLVEVELTISSKNDYEYLVIEDHKPAGFEPVEVRSGYNGNALGAYVEFRDETVCFYDRVLPRGERTVTYRLRAETPGRFSALPAQISAMYAPDLRGNSNEIKIAVEDRPE